MASPPGPSADARVLILGGTAEARALAAALVADGRPVTSSLAGRVRDPALPVGEVRVGGFSRAGLDGVAGLSRYLVAHRIGTVVDATHPFAATISEHAVLATGATGVGLLRLVRPGWRDHPDAGRWTWVDSTAAAVRAGAATRRPFLTTGRQSLGTFLGRAASPSRPEQPAGDEAAAGDTRVMALASWADKDATVRVVDPPEIALPARWRLIRSRGPYAYDDECALMVAAGTDLLVTKDSGGRHTAAKLAAARDLDVPVLVIARPVAPSGVPAYATVGEVLAALS